MNITDFMFIITVIMAIMVVFTSIISMSRLKYEKRYNELERKVEINQIRSHLEKQIYELNTKLTAGEEKWKEANHLIISSQEALAKSEDGGEYDFLSSLGIQRKELAISEKSAFILMPFNYEFDETYSNIKEACYSLEFKCYRSDENIINGDILPDIIKKILSSQVIIAVIDGRNPNVFYELGIAHALNKKVILIAKNMDRVPFDLQSKNILMYNTLDELRSKLKEVLYKTLLNMK